VNLQKSITITMSETAPIKIDPAKWPKIASAGRADGDVDYAYSEAPFAMWYIAVREHEDGRRIVYGWKRRAKLAGFLLGSFNTPLDNASNVTDEATIRAIRRVAGVIGDEDLGAECIGDLPAQEIE